MAIKIEKKEMPVYVEGIGGAFHAGSNYSYHVQAWVVIRWLNDDEAFENWCLRALSIGFEPVGGLSATHYCSYRQAFMMDKPICDEAYCESVKAFLKEWDEIE